MINKIENCTIANPLRHRDFVKHLYIVLPRHVKGLPILEHLWPQTVFAKKSTTRAVFWKSR